MNSDHLQVTEHKTKSISYFPRPQLTNDKKIYFPKSLVSSYEKSDQIPIYIIIVKKELCKECIILTTNINLVQLGAFVIVLY